MKVKKHFFLKRFDIYIDLKFFYPLHALFSDLFARHIRKLLFFLKFRKIEIFFLVSLSLHNQEI